ncbi:hypothetical protein IFM89_018822 [Coptis chinensis]|uniref:non-specific serine/threonine protein kinase n=1 Tax=Coptis chinensis TaxID=261450 RepID=A0A835LIZ6_9MAGN|nr:hypothetical protein IFM89_018822 [Coptis chinensis]
MKPISIFFLYLLLILSSYFHSIHAQNPPISRLDFFNTPARRNLLAHRDTDALQEKTLVSFSDGTVFLVDTNSGQVIWDLKTGPPMSFMNKNAGAGGTGSDEEENTVVLEGEGRSDTFLDDKYTVDIEDGLVHTKDSGERNLVKIVEDYISGAPYLSKNRISFGEKKYTVLTVDIRTGKVIGMLALSGGRNTLVEMNSNKMVESTPSDPENVELLTVTRTDYILMCSSREPHKVLWNITFSRIQAALLDQEREPQVPVVHVRDGTLIRFVLELARKKHNGAVALFIPESNENSISQGDTGNTGPVVKETSHENKVFHHSKLQYVAVLCFLMVFVSWYTDCIAVTKQKSSKELNGSSGKYSVVPKKKKSRKLGNFKNNGNTETIAKSLLNGAVEKSTGRSSVTRSNNEPWSNIEIPVDADSRGRMIGKLFISGTEIAKGSNGTIVIEGIYDGRPVAVKRLVQAHHDVAYKEIQNLIASDRHPNIVRWYGVEYDSDFVYLSLERCTCSLGDLIKMCSNSLHNSVSAQGKSMSSAKKNDVQLDIKKGIIKDIELWKANGYPSPQLLGLMRSCLGSTGNYWSRLYYQGRSQTVLNFVNSTWDIISGLVHLHELGIIHRDLKPQNILIINEKYLCAKLSDMGISKRLLEDKSSLGHHPTGYGSSGWQAPEQLLHGRQTRAVDLFSLGCVLFFCITGGKHPYGDHLERDINVVKNRVDLFMVDNIPEAMDLFTHLLDPNPEARVELEDRENNSDILNALENVAPTALGGNWDVKMETKFLNNIGRYRRYKFESARDLLRVVRNKLNHYRELPKEIQEILGPVPEGFDGYFSSRFPKFLIEVYKVIYRYCWEEECFRKYFKTV